MPLGIFRVTAFLHSPLEDLYPPSIIPSLFINMPVSSSGCKLLQEQRPCFHSSFLCHSPTVLSIAEGIAEPAVHISDGVVNSLHSDINNTILAYMKTWYPPPHLVGFTRCSCELELVAYESVRVSYHQSGFHKVLCRRIMLSPRSWMTLHKAFDLSGSFICYLMRLIFLNQFR